MTERPVRFPVPLVRALIREARHPGSGKSQARFPAWEPALRIVGGKLAAAVLLPRVGSLAVLPHRPSAWCRIVEGDRLWVQEPWWFRPWGSVVTGGARTGSLLRQLSPAAGQVFYFATDLEAFHARCRSGATMPQWASRLTLTVTAAYRQRLRQVSEEDALAEGLQRDGARFWWDDPAKTAGLTAREVFATLWDSRHGEGSWLADPDVVVLAFTVALKTL